MTFGMPIKLLNSCDLVVGAVGGEPEPELICSSTYAYNMSGVCLACFYCPQVAQKQSFFAVLKAAGDLREDDGGCHPPLTHATH